MTYCARDNFLSFTGSLFMMVPPPTSVAIPNLLYSSLIGELFLNPTATLLPFLTRTD